MKKIHVTASIYEYSPSNMQSKNAMLIANVIANENFFQEEVNQAILKMSKRYSHILPPDLYDPCLNYTEKAFLLNTEKLTLEEIKND